MVATTNLISTGNTEIDKKIGGGLPPNSLTLVEGESDSGKSVLVQQFLWGSLGNGMRIAVYTTENTTQSLLRQMSSLSLDVEDYFLVGRLNVFPVPNTFTAEKGNNVFHLLLNHIERMPQVQAVIIDSLTAFVTHAEETQTLDFFSRAKALCDNGRSLMLTMHSYASNEQLLTRLRR